jgi:hypothetical protein
VSYQFVCEACRQALDLPPDRAYLNRIRRSSGGFSTSENPKTKPRPEVFRRDVTGKPFVVGFRQEDQFVGTSSVCHCVCASKGHDPWQCSGEGQFPIGGRPGSGLVDKLAEQLGIEPIPEMIMSAHEECEALARATLAWLRGSTDDERLKIEAELEAISFKDTVVPQLQEEFRGRLSAELIGTAPYRDLKINLVKLARYRNRIAHSWPAGTDRFARIKRARGMYVTVSTTPDELAEHLDLAAAVKSQLAFIPLYIESVASTATGM